MDRRLLIGLALLALASLIVACSGIEPVEPDGSGDPGGGGDDPPIDPPPDDPPVEQVKLVDHSVVEAFGSIPDSVFAQVDAEMRLYYGHTSHGRQLLEGMAMLAAEFPACADIPYIREVNDDLGHLGDVTWAETTRTWLDSGGRETDVVLWSWCGGCSDNTPAGVDAYLQAMSELETDYPDVVFIYMTGHLDGTGTGGNLYASNDRIRAYCAANDKWLYDFADIESYDPDGNHYPDASDACEWCENWCATHDCGDCEACAHSHCFNCYRKGKAFWWLLARISGWESPATE